MLITSLLCFFFCKQVAENDVRSSRFCFSPITTGDITLKISALTTVAGLSDAVEQVVSVKVSLLTCVYIPLTYLPYTLRKYRCFSFNICSKKEMRRLWRRKKRKEEFLTASHFVVRAVSKAMKRRCEISTTLIVGCVSFEDVKFQNNNRTMCIMEAVAKKNIFCYQ